MKWLRAIKAGWDLGTHPDELEFRGKCACGKCAYWTVKFRGRAYNLTESAYDKLRWIASVKT
jgi:hypothetical protein